MRKGFTLLEILIVIGLVGIILAIVVGSFHKAQIKKEQDAIVQELVADLEKQKSDTVTGKDGDNFGIYFDSENNAYTLYQGSSFDSEDSSNKIKNLDSKFSLEAETENSDTEILFSKLTGATTQNATITISHIDEKTNPQSILIEQSGNISVLKLDNS